MKCDTIADLERFLQIQEQAMGPMSAEVATTASKLADLYFQVGKFDAAEPLYKRALQIRQNLNGFHRNEVRESEECLHKLTAAREQANRRANNPFARQALASELRNNPSEASRAAHTGEHSPVGAKSDSTPASPPYVSPPRYTGVSSSDSISPVTADGRQRITSPHLMQDTIKETEVELDLLKQMVGQEHPSVADMLTRLADLYCRLRMYNKMEPILIEALRIREACCGADHISVSTELKNLARLYLAQERFAIAEPLFKRALVIRERVFGRDHTRVTDIEEQYALLLRKTNRIQQADALDKHIEKVRSGAGDSFPKQTNSIIFKSI